MTDQNDRASIASQQVVGERLKGFSGEIELHALKAIMVEVDKLKPNPYNPNKQSPEEFELLCRSMKSEGFTGAILCNMDYVIIDGEHRWQAAKHLGKKKVPVVLLDLDDVRMKIATIRHNKAKGTHDAGLEALVLADLERLAGADFIEQELMIDGDTLSEILDFKSAPDELAGEEFEHSWQPVKALDSFDVDENNKPKAALQFKKRQSVDGALVFTSATNQANDVAYEKATNQKIGQGLNMLMGVYGAEEATLIESVLTDTSIPGDTPSERFYYICEQLRIEQKL